MAQASPTRVISTKKCLLQLTRLHKDIFNFVFDGTRSRRSIEFPK